MRLLRRLLAFILALAVLAAAAYCYARYIEPGRLSIETLNIAGAGLDAPARLAVFSDVHLGNGVDTGDLRQLAKDINAALRGRGGGKPDFVQGSVAAGEAEIRKFFADLAASAGME